MLLILSGCTQDSVVKNTALRHVVIQFDEELKAYPDQSEAKEVRQRTDITVENINMTKEDEALVTVQIKTIKGSGDLTPVTRQVPVKVVKKGTWSVEAAAGTP